MSVAIDYYYQPATTAGVHTTTVAYEAAALSCLLYVLLLACLLCLLAAMHEAPEHDGEYASHQEPTTELVVPNAMTTYR